MKTCWSVRVLLLTFLLLSVQAGAAERKTRNVFLVTTDGFRWQELFGGPELALIDRNAGGVKDTNAIKQAYWRANPVESRQVLLPRFWKLVQEQGQVIGNRSLKSEVRVTNGHNFSYPGYSEFLTGVVDSSIDSNDRRPNPNENVFQWLAAKPAWKDRVFAAVSWGVIPWILNSDKAGFEIWSAFEMPAGSRRIALEPEVQRLLDRTTPIWADVSLDTFNAAVVRQVFARSRPWAGYIAWGETDDWAHEGRYDLYLHSAHNFDRFLGEFWEMLQSMPEYRGTTSLVITTDHGRGSGPVAWKSHGKAITESAATWIAVIGPDVQVKGELAEVRATSSQVAATVAALIGEDFAGAHPKAAGPVTSLLGRP